MVADGELSARRLGRSWAIDDADVAAAVGVPHRPGRPLSARSAWAVLAQFGDLDMGPMSRSETIRARSRAVEAASLQPGALSRRARLYRLRGPSGSLKRVYRDDRFLKSGASVAVGGLVVHEFIEGYVSDDDLAALIDEHALRPVGMDVAQILLRVPAVAWPFGDRTDAPEAVAAADLLDGNDSRSVEAGRAIFAQAVARQFVDHSVAQ
jgi:hypothetical protein